jgi:hypothetical protein
MTALVPNSIESEQQQPFFCLFPPVAKQVRSSILRVKLKMQFSRQSHIVPPAPISSTQATNGLVTHWLPSYIADQLFIEMCEAEIDDPGGIDGEKSSKYYIEAAKYAGRISAGNFEGANAKYRPVFEIHYNDFTARLQEELKTLLKESPSTLASVVESAVFRIFKARHKLIFYDYIENDGLNWRFVAAD